MKRSAIPTVLSWLFAATAVLAADPAKVLILSGLNNHNWSETTPCLKKMLEESGRFSVETTDHPEQLAPGDLDKFDVIVSNWNSWKKKDIEKQWSPELRKAYLDFVRGGKGHVVLHAGSSSFYDWPEYQQLCGFSWTLGQTGHGPRHSFRVRPTAVDHPITHGLEPFETFDELWNRPGTQPGVTVLAESFSAKDKRGTGNWEPSLLVNSFGKGRNVGIVLGHDAKAMSSPGFRALLTRSTEWAATGSVTLGASAGAVGRTLDWKRDDGALCLLSGGKALWGFHYGKKDPKPHFDPMGVIGGPSMTWVSPPDHPWHYGLWFSWKFINGVNYWEDDGKARPVAGETRWNGAEVETQPDGAARIGQDLLYAPRDKDPALAERRIIVVSAPDADGSYHMDWTLEFKALQDVELNRTPIPGEPGGKGWGGYAGLSLRMPAGMEDRQVAVNEGDTVWDGDRIRMKAGAMDYSGEFGGKPYGVAIFDHPGNLNSPTPWYAIRSKTMTYFSPAVICYGPHKMKAGESFTLRYRVCVHGGRWDRAELTRQLMRYSAS